jgi:hypothetical protein
MPARHSCGRTVFTKGSFKVRLHYHGRDHVERYSVPLDKCPR